jgi:hypothetical protein
MKAMRRLATAAAGVLCLLPLGCSASMDVRLSGSLEAPTITFVREGEGPSREVCIDQLVVFEVTEPDRPDVRVWELAVRDPQPCVEVEALEYGRAPPALAARTGPGALRPGVLYEVFASGWTKGRGSIPWFAGERFVFRDGAWTPVPQPQG